MFWKVRTTLGTASIGNGDAAVFSRREMLARIGLTGVCAVAGPAVLASTPAEARAAPVAEPISDAARTEAADGNAAERTADASQSTEFSSQDWRRRRRRRWRRRSRVVCRRRWRRGRVVRVCRRVWY